MAPLLGFLHFVLPYLLGLGVLWIFLYLLARVGILDVNPEELHLDRVLSRESIQKAWRYRA